MRISVPLTTPPPIGPQFGARTPIRAIHRLSGLGQSDDDDDDDDGGDSFTCSGVCPSGQMFDSDLCECVGLPYNTTGSGVTSGVCPGSCPSGQFMDQSSCTCVGAISTNPVVPGSACINSSGQIGTTDSNGNCTGSGSSLSSSQISSLLTASASVLKSVETPYQIAGTGLIYNPATGQIVSSTAVTASSIASSLGSIMPMLLLLAGVVVFLPMLTGGGRH